MIFFKDFSLLFELYFLQVANFLVAITVLLSQRINQYSLLKFKALVVL